MSPMSTDHQPTAVVSVDGMPFVKCSCRDDMKPQSAVWLREHWQGDQASGVAALDEVVARQRAVKRGCVAHDEPRRDCVGCGLLLGPFWWQTRAPHHRPDRGAGMTDDLEALAELGMCQFRENVNDGSMCICGLPAINHDEVAAGIVLRDRPAIAALIARVHLAETSEAGWRRDADEAAAVIARVEALAEERVRAARAEALREAADDYERMYQQPGSATGADWLRTRADHIAHTTLRKPQGAAGDDAGPEVAPEGHGAGDGAGEGRGR